MGAWLAGNINWVWVILLILTFVVVLMLDRVLLGYLRSKGEVRKSLMDSAHIFCFENIKNFAMMNTAIRIVQITTRMDDQFKLIFAHVVDGIHLTARLTLMLSAGLVVLVQFLMAMFPGVMFNLSWPDEQIALITKILSILAMILVSLGIKLSGLNGTAFFLFEGEGNTGTVMALHVPLMISSGLAILARIILRIRYKRFASTVPSNQLISDRHLFCSLPFLVIGVLLKAYGHPGLLESIRVFYPNIGICGYLTLVICLHKGLKRYALKILSGYGNGIKKVMDTLRRCMTPQQRVSPTRQGYLSTGLLKYFSNSL